MSEIFAIVRKDFFVSWKIQLLILTGLSIILCYRDTTQILTVMVFSPIVCGMSFFFLDPPDSLAVFALPVRRTSHVQGRYASTALILLFTIGLYASATLYFRDHLNIRAASLIMAAVMLCLSLLFPIYYRLPRNWALGLTIFIMTIIASTTLGFAIVLTKSEGTIPSAIKNIWRFPFFSHAMVAIAVASYSCSLFVSLRIMARKVL